jgi:AcrR family transcriptional regulator
MLPKARLNPRRRPTQARAKATEEAILAAAAQVLVKDGYDRASTNRIARRAGVSIGSLYQYYPSKEALVSALLERHFEAMLQLLMDTADGLVGASVEEAVPAYVRAMLQIHCVDPGLHQVFFEQFPRLGGIARAHDFLRRSSAVVRRYLEAHRHRVREMDLDLATFVLVNAVEGVTHAAVLTGHQSMADDRLAKEISTLVLRYLVEPPRPRRARRLPPTEGAGAAPPARS